MVLSQLQLGYGKTIEIRSNVVNHGSQKFTVFFQILLNKNAMTPLFDTILYLIAYHKTIAVS